jgi:hypothetical protein
MEQVMKTLWTAVVSAAALTTIIATTSAPTSAQQMCSPTGAGSGSGSGASCCSGGSCGIQLTQGAGSGSGSGSGAATPAPKKKAGKGSGSAAHAGPKGDQGPSSKAYDQANIDMHKGMDIRFTGDADVDFARGMIPHHQGAVEMAKIVLKYGRDPELKKLAEEIIKAQEFEIGFMKDWLSKKGK